MSLTLKTPPVEPSAATHGRIPQLDGLRAVAILAVFLNHSMDVPLTWVGVDIFFVLSGFLITGILLQRKQMGSGYFSYFYARRAFRILPPYLLALALFGTVFTWKVFQPWPLFAFFGMNLQRSFMFTHMTNPLPLWSLAVEEQFYFVWPFVILMVSEKVLFRLAMAALVITPILRFIVTPFVHSQFTIYMLTPFRADLLCAGAVLAILWKHRGPVLEARCRTWGWIGCGIGFGGLALAQISPLLRLSAMTPTANALDYSLSVLGSFSLLAWVLADRGWLRALLASGAMRFIGQISYTMYLTHLVAVFLMRQVSPSKVVVTLLALPISIAYAAVSWYLVEKPLINFAARKVPGHPRVRSANEGLPSAH
jgi:peptidoglycan/LPS O-acetylase OafA/YrhL